MSNLALIQLSVDEPPHGRPVVFGVDVPIAILHRTCLETVGSFGKTHPMMF